MTIMTTIMIITYSNVPNTILHSKIVNKVFKLISFGFYPLLSENIIRKFVALNISILVTGKLTTND